jgi:hypothetical protein
MDQKLEFIICTEKGVLEQMSILLVATIRQFGGKYSNAPIYSYQPRRSATIGKDTLSFFEENNVFYIDEPLNTKYQEYPLANKPLACAHREARSNADILIFLDSDTCFLGESTALDALGNADLAINPTDLPNIATDIHFGKGEAAYWRRMYDELGVVRRKELRTTITKEKILEYYNSGFIVSKRSTGLFEKWLHNFEFIRSQGIRPAKDIFFTEQSVFSATVAQLELEVNPLGNSLNYPISIYTKRWRGYYPYDLKKIKHIHYHKLLSKKIFQERVMRKIAATENGHVINRMIEQLF